MNRLTDHRFAETIQAGLAMLPEGVRQRTQHTNWLTGHNAQFLGVTEYPDGGATDDARNYLDIWHVLYPSRTSDASTTVVMPTLDKGWDDWYTIGGVVHEIGHVLHDVVTEIDWREPGIPPLVPVTPYAATNVFEAFAESFVAWVCWRGGHEGFLEPWFWDGERDIFEADLETVSFFEALSRPVR